MPLLLGHPSRDRKELLVGISMAFLGVGALIAPRIDLGCWSIGHWSTHITRHNNDSSCCSDIPSSIENKINNTM